MSSVLVSTIVNGDPVQFACPTNESLMDVLRNRVGLTGVKEGCGTGDCGACTVTLDGRLACSRPGSHTLEADCRIAGRCPLLEQCPEQRGGQLRPDDRGTTRLPPFWIVDTLAFHPKIPIMVETVAFRPSDEKVLKRRSTGISGS